MSRLFVAIQLSEDMKKAVTASLHDMKKLGVKGSYVPTANLHLTLAFIGETKEVEAAKAAVAGISIKPFRLTLSELGTFGDLLYVGVKGNQGIKGLAKDIRAQLDAAEIPYDQKEFVPHITLVRKMSGTLPKGFSGAKAEMMVKGFSLMKSETKNGKRVYTEIHHVGN